MSEPEKFLTRWSRRKREIEREPDKAHDAPAPENSSLASAQDTSAQNTGEAVGAASATETASESEDFDPASLPPLESITAETDISGYFARGVPGDLMRAALRRVWVADPTIRDFVGLAENAWDFNAPETIPGFGPITASDDVAGMMRQMMGEARAAVFEAGPESNPITPPQVSAGPRHVANQQTAILPSQGQSESPAAEGKGDGISAAQDKLAASMPAAEPAPAPGERAVRPRGHGGALPK